MNWIREILFTSIAFLILTSCGKKKETIVPTVQDITESVYAAGSIKSVNQYYAYPEMNGVIRKKIKQDGDKVFTGDVILELKNDNTRYDADNAALAASYADVNKNPERLNEIQLNEELAYKKMQHDSIQYERQKNLFENQIGSRLELEQRKLAYTTSLNSWRSAQLKSDDLKKQLSIQQKQTYNTEQKSKSINNDFAIRSLLNGTVYQILKEVGEYVTPQQPVALIGENTFYVEMLVDENDITRVQKGQKVLLRFDSYGDSVFDASVSKIYPVMNDRTKTFTVEAEFLNAPAELFPFMTVDANIIIRTQKQAVTIPRSYMLNNHSVLTENGDTLQVKTGAMDLSKVEITGGVNRDTRLQKPQL